MSVFIISTLYQKGFKIQKILTILCIFCGALKAGWLFYNSAMLQISEGVACTATQPDYFSDTLTDYRASAELTHHQI